MRVDDVLRQVAAGAVVAAELARRVVLIGIADKFAYAGSGGGLYCLYNIAQMALHRLQTSNNMCTWSGIIT